MRKLRQERWSDFSKAMELASYWTETSDSQTRNLHSRPLRSWLPPGSCSPWPAHLLFWQGKHLKEALCSEGMLSGISGQGSSAFLATEGCWDNRSPFVLCGLDGSKRMSEGDYKRLWILLVMLPSADAFFNWLVACISRIENARCIYCAERECWRPLERYPAVGCQWRPG